MKAVLISIRPKWAHKIATITDIIRGEPIYQKQIEVRKTKPTIPTPFKCFIYCTESKPYWKEIKDLTLFEHAWLGKVMGEFICDKIEEYSFSNYEAEYRVNHIEEQKMRLNQVDLINYGKGKTLYGWHISNLKIYDTPKELGKFIKPCDKSFDYCDGCEDYSDFYGRCNNKITRPPQSWQYIEENKDE